MSFIKNKLILITSSLDKTLKFWKFDENFIINSTYGVKLFQTITIVEKIKSQYKFFINCICFRDTDKIEIFGGDTEGEVHYFEYEENLDNRDKSYIKFLRKFLLHKPTIQKTPKMYNVHKMTIQKVIIITFYLNIKLVNKFR